jgi:hypothetical protein
MALAMIYPELTLGNARGFGDGGAARNPLGRCVLMG